MNKQGKGKIDYLEWDWNPVKGLCKKGCSYCFMQRYYKRFKLNPKIRFDEKELKTDLGKGNFIFVGSSTDMFANEVPNEWIRRVIMKCKDYDNEYLFQTKNPNRFKIFRKRFPPNTILGITIETNRETPSKATNTNYRAEDFSHEMLYGFRKMVTIEPIMDFDVTHLVDMIKMIQPEFVNIGADSKGHNLPEPSNEKIAKLIEELTKFTEVNLKDNLKRLYTSD
ncbi:hypothetical protein LCGC14_2346180, partial [marine sediment metagenome]